MHPTPLMLPVAANQLGESPFWHPLERCLYWIDIAAKRVHRYHPASAHATQWDLPSEPGTCAPVLRNAAPTQELLLALRTGFYLLNTASGALQKLLDAPYDPTQFRFNDGKCDAAGRLWVGAMYEPRTQELGTLWCLRMEHGRLVVEQKAQGNITTNGVAFSQDNRTLYWAHTRAHRIDCFNFDLDLAHGRIDARRTFKQFALRQDGTAYGGRPDGAAVDTQGNLWCAMYEGGALMQLSPTGQVIQRIALPITTPTMPCFGGDDLKTLYITTAQTVEAHSGQVLVLPVETAGLPVQFFKM